MTATGGAPHIGLVVEGPGDVASVRLLLQAHLHRRGEYRDLLGKPVPLNGKSNATADGGVEGYVATAMRPGCVGVIVVLDADDEPSCEEGPRLLTRASGSVGKPVVIAIAERDFEDWLFASIESLGIEADVAFSPSTRGKGVIQRSLIAKGITYVKPVWQPKLAARVDLDLAASRSASFARLLRKVDELLDLVGEISGATT